MMTKYVIKRDGSKVPFDSSKIYDAIKAATLASHSKMEWNEANDLTCISIVDKVVKLCCYESDSANTDTLGIETVQDNVERALIKEGYADTAKEYILYRNKRTEIRNTRDSISKTINSLYTTESKDNDLKRDNGNIDGDSPMGTMLQTGSNVAKNYYLNNMISKDIVKAYMDGCIYIHDLDFYALTLTCCQIDCLKLFKGGFNTGHGHLREPNSIGSYTTLAAIAIQSNQNDQHR